MGLTTADRLEAELRARGIDVTRIATKGTSLFLFDYNGQPRAIKGINPDASSATSYFIARDKDITKIIADRLGVAVPGTELYTGEPAALAFLRRYGTIVVKPAAGAHGRGVTIGVTTPAVLGEAVARAGSAGKGRVILQQQVSGTDYRIVVIDGAVAAVEERIPAHVIGDGRRTVLELIEHENRTNPRRGTNYEKPLNYIDTEAARPYLGAQIDAIPEIGEYRQVVGTANIGMGGTSVNRTAELPPAIAEEAVRLSRAIGAFVCGVDMMVDTAGGQWHLIELNASPGFGSHHEPSEGAPIDLTGIYVDALLRHYDTH